MPRHRSALLTGLGLTAACTHFNSTDSVCHETSNPPIISLPGTDAQWFSGSKPAIPCSPRGVLLSYLSSDTGPVASESVGLALATVNLEGRTSSSCSFGPDSLDPEAALLATGPSVAATPVMDYACNSGRGAMAYRLSGTSSSTDENGDRIRLAFLGGQGCPTSNEDGTTFFDVEASNPTRSYSDLQVVHLREKRFAVAWLSRDRNMASFDDRVMVRLAQSAGPRFAASATSTNGDAIALPIEDRWILSPLLTGIDVRGVAERQLALIWYAKSSSLGVVKFALFTERLELASSIVVLDTDRDQGNAVENKVISTAYDPARHAFFAVWTKSMDGVSTVVGKRIDLGPSPTASTWLSVTDPRDGPAIAPSVAVLPRGNLFVVWKRASQILGAAFRPDGRRRYTRFGCGTNDFVLFSMPNAGAFNPMVSIVGDGVALLASVEVRQGGRSKWSIHGGIIHTDDIFPDGE